MFKYKYKLEDFETWLKDEENISNMSGAICGIGLEFQKYLSPNHECFSSFMDWFQY